MSLGDASLFAVFAYNLRSPSERTWCSTRRSTSCFAVGRYEFCVDLSPCSDLFSRGLVGRSCQCATVPLPVPSWTPADRGIRPRSGNICPTPLCRFDRPAGSRPLHNRLDAWPRWPRSTGRVELARSRRDSLAGRRRINTVTKVERCLRRLVVDATLHLPDAEDRATVGTDPSAAVRARRGMRVGRQGSPLFFAPRAYSSLSFMR